MNWEPIFAVLILFTSFTTWLFALLIERTRKRNERRSGKFILIACICVNFIILGLFKYANFFSQIVNEGLSFLHIDITIPNFEILLPVGISFYTFQAIGYIVDVYRRTILAEKNFVTYALFVSFFPQLVAGPIERASTLLPQFKAKHVFNENALIYGLRLMIFGYFMKLCVADNLSPYVDAVYNNLSMHSGKSVLLATFFFSFQILCDFGGYSLIAIGTAKCMGFNLMQNFRQPYNATSIRDFWHRWHISLSTWFTDYVYIPLGGNRTSPIKHGRNLMITFITSGLWHGANTTFLVWGLYHGVLITGQNIFFKKKDKKKRIKEGKFKYAKIILSIVFTFVLVMLGWVFFRADTIGDAVFALRKMIIPNGPLYNGDGLPAIFMSLLMIGLLIIFEAYNEHHSLMGCAKDNFVPMTKLQKIKSITFTVFLLLLILTCGQFNGGQFIYFQF